MGTAGKTAFIFFTCCLLITACAVKPADVEDGFLFDADGCRINGSFLPPSKPDGYCFILLHGLGSDHKEWKEFSRTLEAAGWGYLAYDARGHGGSSADKKGNPVSYRYFINEWSKMVPDLGLAVKFLKRNRISDRRIIVVGASLGANVALSYCAGNPAIPILVMLSPGIEYATIRTPEAINEYGDRRLVISASPQDTYAYRSSKLLMNKVSNRNKTLFIEGEGALHGAGILTTEKIELLLRYLGSSLKPGQNHVD